MTQGFTSGYTQTTKLAKTLNGGLGYVIPRVPFLLDMDGPRPPALPSPTSVTTTSLSA